MEKINIQFTLFSAFYSPLISTMSGGFLEAEGLEPVWSVAPPGVSAVAALSAGTAHVVQSALSVAFAPLNEGKTPGAVHFAQVDLRVQRLAEAALALRPGLRGTAGILMNKMIRASIGSAMRRMSHDGRCCARALSVACISAAMLMACTGAQRLNVLVPDGSPSVVVMDFRQPLALDPPPAGWWHRTFFRTAPMQISFGSKDGRPSIRLATHDSASMLYRYTDIPVDQFPMLAWDWFVEQPIESDADETTKAGDDHPARLYLKFRTATGDTHAMEIIWGNRKLRAGDWKYLQSPWTGNSFPHYVARGGNENAGRWHDERVDLRTLYRKQWGDPAGASLIEVALFADTDATGARSVAYFSVVRLDRQP